MRPCNAMGGIPRSVTAFVDHIEFAQVFETGQIKLISLLKLNFADCIKRGS